MRLIMASVRDSKADAWQSPLFFQSSAQAVRSFIDAVNDRSTEFGKHPEDYTLFELGTFDQRSGEIEVHIAPQALGVGVNFIREES